MRAGQRFHIVVVSDQDRVIRRCRNAYQGISRTLAESALVKKYDLVAGRFQCMPGRNRYAFVEKKLHAPWLVLGGAFAILVF